MAEGLHDAEQSAANAAVLPARMSLDIDAPSFLTMARTTKPPPSSAALLLTALLVNVRTRDCLCRVVADGAVDDPEAAPVVDSACQG